MIWRYRVKSSKSRNHSHSPRMSYTRRGGAPHWQGVQFYTYCCRTRWPVESRVSMVASKCARRAGLLEKGMWD